MVSLTNALVFYTYILPHLLYLDNRENCINKYRIIILALLNKQWIIYDINFFKISS